MAEGKHTGQVSTGMHRLLDEATQLGQALDVIVASQGSGSSAVGPLVRELTATHRLLATAFQDTTGSVGDAVPASPDTVSREVERLGGRIDRTDARLTALIQSVSRLVTLLETKPVAERSDNPPERGDETNDLLRQLQARNTELEREVSRHRDVEVSLLTTMRDVRAASQAKSEFLANMSHELRTPLNAIIGFAEIMESQLVGPLGSEQYVGYAKDVRESGQYLLELINDILDLSKIESGQLEFVEDVVDLNDTAEVCIRMVGDQATEAGLETSLEVTEGLPAIRANTRMIRQILLNLLSNSIKFTPSGGKVAVSIRQESGSGDVLLKVIDTGIGIDPKDVSRVMRPFEQVESAQASRQRGTGLGLPMAKSLVELHGGVFTLDSVVGEGTTVTIRFPVERVVS